MPSRFGEVVDYDAADILGSLAFGEAFHVVENEEVSLRKMSQ